MKKIFFLLLCFLLGYNILAQEKPVQRNVTLKWAPTGLILGSIGLQGEYNFGGQSSLTAKIGLPVNARHTFKYDGDDAEFNLKATSFLAGYRMYLSKKHLKGWYFEPFFKYVHHTSEGAAKSTLNNRPVQFDFTNDYNGVGIGAQLGVQFLIKKRFVIDFFLFGPEVNSASNNFKAAEVTAGLPWTFIEANEAEHDIRDFINDFPFIRDKTNVMVDKDNRKVTADFKGILPGLRMGFSLGIAF